MANDENVDRRTVRTCNAIETTFQQMVCEMDEKAINVKAISERAGINRKTFYLHYSCIEDLFQNTCDKICEDYSETLAIADPESMIATSEEEAILRFYRAFYEYFTSQDLYVERLICSPSYYTWGNQIIDACAAVNRKRRNIYKSMTDEERSLFNNLAAVSLFNTYRQWVALGKNISIDSLVEFSHKFIYHGMSCVLGN